MKLKKNTYLKKLNTTMTMDMDMTSNYMNPIANANANHPVAATTTTGVGLTEEGGGGGNLPFGLSDCNNNNNNNNSDNSHILPRPLPPSMYHNNDNDNDNNNFIQQLEQQQLEQQLLMAAQAQTQAQIQTQNSYNSSLHSNPQLPQQIQPRQQQEQQQQQGEGLGVGVGTSRDSTTTCTDTHLNVGLQLHRVPVVVPTDRDIMAGRSGRYSARCNSGSLYYYKLIDTMYSEYYQPNDPYIHHNSIERQHNSIKRSILQRRSTIVNTIIQRCKNDKIITTPVVNGPGRFIRKIDKRRNELEVMDDKAIALKIVSTVFFCFFLHCLLNTTNYYNLHKIRYLHSTTHYGCSLSHSLSLFTEKSIYEYKKETRWY
jgi:hypothetical protein